MVNILLHYTTNWEPIAEIVIPIYEEYAAKHGYRTMIYVRTPYEKYDGLFKMLLINKVEEGDIALVVDCDTIVTNFNVKVEDYAVKDLNLSKGINCGIMIIRKTKWLSDFFNRIISKIESGEYHCEQDAIEAYMSIFPDYDKVMIHPHPCFNSFLPELYGHIPNPEEITHEKGRWLLGDFVCHLPSLSMETRIEKLKELKEKIIR